MNDYHKFLAENILAEDKVVTYRLLSRALHVNVNVAKQMLFDYHRSQNAKRPGTVHATYVVYGTKNASDGPSATQNGGDGDIEMASSPPEPEALADVVPTPTTTISLITEERLKETLEEYEEVTAIHVYSVGPHPTKDMALLADAANRVLTLNPGHDQKSLVPITNSRVRRRERQGAGLKAAAAATAAAAEPQAKPMFPKSAQAPASAKVKEESKPSQPVQETAEKTSSSGPAKKAAPALKRGGSSNIMQAFSKAATKPTKVKKEAETSQPATPSDEDPGMQPMSDDGEDDDELPQPKPRSTSGFKSKKQREDELRQMMDEDGEEETPEKAESPEEEVMEEEPPAPEPAKEEETEVVTASANGRRRGKRRVMRKKQVMDDQGYLGWEKNQEPLTGNFDKAACPDYAVYATFPHPPLSNGPLQLPFQRPNSRCRTFHSDAIEKVIADMTSRMKDPDLARLFENAFPSTTDTTVKFHTDGKDEKIKQKLRSRQEKDAWLDEGEWEGSQSFIITGDILAEWLRDSTNQLKPYQALAMKDPSIFTLILGAINTQSEYVIQSPYCNAFQPPPISGLPVSFNGQDDAVHPIYEPSAVFECKYELDSLAHFLALANEFHSHTGSKEFMNPRWYKAIGRVLSVLEEQSQSTFDSETGGYRHNTYTFQRNTNTGTETLNLGGVGNPLNNGTGLIRSAFRPSDDATIFGFFIPANAQMAVELRRTAAILLGSGSGSTAAGGKTSSSSSSTDAELAQTLEDWSRRITEGIWEHGVVRHKKYGDVFAYEVDGYGSALLMDDANYPSLLALPLMGFVRADDATYRNTRKMLLEKTGNPYFLTGRQFQGIGGPHIGLQNAWPMSLLVQAQTSDDDDEIMQCLHLVLTSSKLGLIHESVNVNYAHSFTRNWFAWANGVFAETILNLAKRKPHLIFTDSRPYDL
ncbi:hypothetical protein C8A00DRAFT_17710 [Chaetomidium leptoderma]|uniref:DNA polymerase delta subunit 3 n=1 Tax=Chaetomidium leptoderma TaxID=669021 RepID=A0AAN6VHV0_9PEZI|nr:hypothetical protein C8A00DRAFT_17710 [Chaetomidium leptoderma]